MFRFLLASSRSAHLRSLRTLYQNQRQQSLALRYSTANKLAERPIEVGDLHNSASSAEVATLNKRRKRTSEETTIKNITSKDGESTPESSTPAVGSLETRKKRKYVMKARLIRKPSKPQEEAPPKRSYSKRRTSEEIEAESQRKIERRQRIKEERIRKNGGVETVRKATASPPRFYPKRRTPEEIQADIQRKKEKWQQIQHERTETKKRRDAEKAERMATAQVKMALRDIKLIADEVAIELRSIERKGIIDKSEEIRTRREALLAGRAEKKAQRKILATLAKEQKQKSLELNRRADSLKMRKMRVVAKDLESKWLSAFEEGSQVKVDMQDAAIYLNWVVTSRQGGKKAMSDKKRVNLTSTSLSNDILERLKPSLEKHKGCDIVDINPGAGIWSSTIHEYLKPRSHILLEPDEKFYSPFLQPLLDAPDSTYSLIPNSGIIWRFLEDALTKEHLPFQEAYEKDDPRLLEDNDTLLVLMNLGFHPPKPFRGFASMSQLVIHQLLSSIMSNSLFQKYGLVRMLIWCGDKDASKVMPKSISSRRKASIEAEISCKNIVEVASSTELSHLSQKYPILEDATTALVERKMIAAGVITPANRESDSLQQLRRNRCRTDNQFPPEFIERLLRLEAQFEAEMFKATIDGSPLLGDGDGLDANNTLTPEYAKLCLHRRQYNAGLALPPSLQQVLDIYQAHTELQKACFRCTDEGEKDQMKKDLELLEKKLELQMERTGPEAMKNFLMLADSNQATQTDPPVLAWNRRDYEPLKVHSDEFYPMHQITLLDLQPKAIWPILREDYPANWETFEFILGQLMMVSKQPLKRGLEALAPGAYEWLVEHCPLLTDPTKGGSINPGQIRVRMLTTDQLRQMIEAWMKWPFRPTRYELIARAGSANYDADAPDDESGAGGLS